jgi:predicted phosphodiesterase
MAPLLFAGDPHGNFAPLIRACAARDRPGTLVVVGDFACSAPLPTVLAPVFEAGWDVRWILGNHDTDDEAAYDRVAGAHPEGDIGLRVSELAGSRVAGLPGVFKPRVWHPRGDVAERVDPPQFHTRAEFQASLRPDEAWRGGLPLWHRDTIFPEDVRALERERFDVLVAHEAPSSHPHGFDAIDALARAGGARWIVHGHHHLSYRGEVAGGIAVRGLGVAEVWEFEA